MATAVQKIILSSSRDIPFNGRTAHASFVLDALEQALHDVLNQGVRFPFSG